MRICENKTYVLAVSKENDPSGKPQYKIFIPSCITTGGAFLTCVGVQALRRLDQKEHAVNVIIIEHSYFGWLGILLRGLTKKPFVIRSHNIEAHRFRDMRQTGGAFI
jgi:hypothetical protein